MNFSGKTILVTGASAGIGAAIARELARKASTLVLVARREGMLEALRSELIASHPSLQVIIQAIDIVDPEQQGALVSDLHRRGIRVDVLVNNAGIGDQALFDASEPSRLQAMIDLNIGAVVSLTRRFAPDFVRDPDGRAVVFVGSGAGVAWMPGSAVYSATKHFVTAFAMNLHAEWKPLGIDVGLVLPGPVDSEFDERANIKGGMVGGPAQKTRISAEACAVDTVRLLEAGKLVVIPGVRIRRLMNAYFWLPWAVRQRMLEKEGRRVMEGRAL
jgi:uncharacterized protein